MKTSVSTIMMSFALMGCLLIGASDASAQGRSRSQGGSATSRSQSAAVSRSSSNSSPTVSRNTSPSVSRSAATPQVDRSSRVSGHSASSPRVDRSSSVSSSRAATPQVTQRSTPSRNNDITPRGNRGATTRGGNSGGSKGTVTHPSSSPRPSDSAIGTRDKATKSDRTSTVAPSTMTDRHGSTRRGDGTRPGINTRPGGNTKPGDNKGGIDKPGGNKGGIDRPSGNRPNDRHGKRPGGNGRPNDNHGYSPKHRFDYSNHHYRNEFSWNHSHHNWSRPLPPPARAHRPAPLLWRRPVIPVGWRPYASAPVIDRILGLMFGTLYEASLDHLYYSGYYIDGYADGIIYLRDVPMLNLYWPDVMLNYEYNKLVNAQFVYHSSYYDRARFDRAYRSLCRIYGSPVFQDGMTISWYGGNNTGWVTLTMTDSYGDYCTTMSIGY